MMNSETCVEDHEAEVQRYWISLADDSVQRVVHGGHLYIIFDPKTMIDTGSALHRVGWSDPGKPKEDHSLIPQGAVPDWIRSRFPDNASSLEYLDR